MKKAIIVLSGGMDSTTALAWALDNPQVDVAGAIHFQYGSKHNGKEFYAAIAVAKHYNVDVKLVYLQFMNELFKSDLLQSGGEIPEGHYADESMKRTVVPFRNGIMLAVAAGYAESVGANAVVLGNHFGDHAIYPDCREDFIKPMREAVKNGTYAQVEVMSPFQRLDKAAIATIGNHLKAPLGLTWTCYKGGDVHCGKCGSCRERMEAFQLAQVPDPTTYAAQ